MENHINSILFPIKELITETTLSTTPKTLTEYGNQIAEQLLSQVVLTKANQSYDVLTPNTEDVNF